MFELNLNDQTNKQMNKTNNPAKQTNKLNKQTRLTNQTNKQITIPNNKQKNKNKNKGMQGGAGRRTGLSVRRTKQEALSAHPILYFIVYIIVMCDG